MINHRLTKNKQFKIDYAYILLIFTIIGQWYFIFTKAKEKENITTELIKKEQMISLLSGNIKMHYVYSEKQLQESMLIDKTGHKLKLSSLINNKRKIILKYSPSNCSECIQFGISLMEKFASTISNENLAIIVTDATEREFQVISSLLTSDIPVYMTSDKAFGSILNKENVPFIFVIDNSLYLKDLFIPIKEIPSHSEMYIKIIKNKYFADIKNFGKTLVNNKSKLPKLAY